LDRETPAEAEAAAQSIQFDLSLAYAKMLSRIRPKGLRLIQWVFFARYPLTLEQLRFATAIKEGMRDLDSKRDLPFPSFTDCALGLLVVDSKEKTVRFVHSTIRDYLTKHSLQYFPDGHVLLARTCLTYLSFSSLSSEIGRIRFLQDGDLFPFFEYAGFEWGHHARELNDDTKACDTVLSWLLSEHFMQVRDVRHQDAVKYQNVYPSDTQHSRLHEACVFGLQ
jgi:hypothetical protein